MTKTERMDYLYLSSLRRSGMKDFLDPDNMHDWLASLWPKKQSISKIVAGVNDDDCAVLKWNHKFLVITTDFLNASPICMELGIGNPYILGRLTVASSMSDLCGTGAKPHSFMIAVTMPRNSSTEEFKELMKGVKAECKKYGVSVVGGDTKLGKSLAIISTGIGYVASKKNLFLKNHGKPGQLLWVSGTIGSCTAAILALTLEDNISQVLKRWATWVLTVPQIPLSKSQLLSKAGFGISGIDISDGLGEDIYRLCEASNTGVVIDANKIPISQRAHQIAKMRNLPRWILPFGCGGDFQFLVTTSPKHENEVEKMGFHLIGEFIKETQYLLKLPNGKGIALPRTGHRDVRNLSFAQETNMLIKEICNE